MNRITVINPTFQCCLERGDGLSDFPTPHTLYERKASLNEMIRYKEMDFEDERGDRPNELRLNQSF